MGNRLALHGLASLLVSIALAVQAAAASPAERCRAEKLKASAKAAACLLNEGAKVVLGKSGDALKCPAKLAARFEALEEKGGAECVTIGDTAAIDARIDAAVVGIDQALSGQRFVDNGDETITDTATGLMWEKKDDSGGLHDKDGSFTWTQAMGDWISEVNGHTDVTNPKTPGFAGYSDWRVPTVDELQTILLEPFPCETDPCIDPVFGPTVGDTMITSSTVASSPANHWSVKFNDGDLRNTTPKGNANHVRAVRGGF